MVADQGFREKVKAIQTKFSVTDGGVHYITVDEEKLMEIAHQDRIAAQREVLEKVKNSETTKQWDTGHPILDEIDNLLANLTSKQEEPEASELPEKAYTLKNLVVRDNHGSSIEINQLPVDLFKGQELSIKVDAGEQKGEILIYFKPEAKQEGE